MPPGINMDERTLAHLQITKEILEEMLDDVVYDDTTLATVRIALDQIDGMLKVDVE